MPHTVEEQRRIGRASYARSYPLGLKRRRNAAQTALQRIAQRRYQLQPEVVNSRRLQRQVRHYISGKGKAGAAMIGCSQEDLKAHLDSTLNGALVLQWKLAYRRPPSSFVPCEAGYHYTNIYAKPVALQGSSLCPLQQALSPTDS